MGEIKLQIKAKFKLKDYLLSIKAIDNVGYVSFYLYDINEGEYIEKYAETSTTSYFIINNNQNLKLILNYGEGDIFQNIEEVIDIEEIIGSQWGNFLPTKIYVGDQNTLDPISGAGVTIYEDGGMTNILSSGTTGPDGFVTLPILPDKVNYYFTATATGYSNYAQNKTIPPRPEYHEITLAPSL